MSRSEDRAMWVRVAVVSALAGLAVRPLTADEQHQANMKGGLIVERATQTFAIALEREPALVRIDPAGWVLAEWKSELGVDVHAAALRGDPSPICRIRAARALAKESHRAAREALASALAGDPSWAVSVETAAALGESRSPSARSALLDTIAHPHPKVRRAVAEALGTFRDPEVAGALLGMLDDVSYFVIAATYHALGRTRDPRAFDALVAGTSRPSWNDTIACGALRGLGALADARASDVLLAASAPERSEFMRRVAVVALAELANAVDGIRSTRSNSCWAIAVTSSASPRTPPQRNSAIPGCSRCSTRSRTRRTTAGCGATRPRRQRTFARERRSPPRSRSCAKTSTVCGRRSKRCANR